MTFVLSALTTHKPFALSRVHRVSRHVLALFDHICTVYFISVTPGTLNIIVMVSKVLEINCGIAEEISKTTIMD